MKPNAFYAILQIKNSYRENVNIGVLLCVFGRYSACEFEEDLARLRFFGISEEDFQKTKDSIEAKVGGIHLSDKWQDILTSERLIPVDLIFVDSGHKNSHEDLLYRLYERFIKKSHVVIAEFYAKMLLASLKRFIPEFKNATSYSSQDGTCHINADIPNRAAYYSVEVGSDGDAVFCEVGRDTDPNSLVANVCEIGFHIQQHIMQQRIIEG